MNGRTTLQIEFDEAYTALELILTDIDSCTINDVLDLLGWAYNGHCHKIIIHTAVTNGYRVERMHNERGAPYRIFDW